MKLFYYKDEIGNFGDDLNPWLWSKIANDILDEDSSELFVGIGTLLNHKLPDKPIKHIFGSGVGYGELPVVNESWKIHALRGPYTASQLNVSKELVITDSALLIREVEEPVSNFLGEVGLFPHYLSSRTADWENIANEAGLLFISPEWSVEKVLAEMKKCKLILTEAMHGAIVADALRIPWQPLILGQHVNTIKWQDWLDTVNLTYTPVQTIEYFKNKDQLSLTQKIKDEVKRQLIKTGINQSISQPPHKNSNNNIRSKVIKDLVNFKNSSQGFLSDELIQNKLLSQYVNVLDKMRN